MPRDKFVEVSALNIAADPHPDHVYIELLEKSSTMLLNIRSNDYAKITKPEKYDNIDAYTGQIHIWTDINTNGKWFDLENEGVLSDDIKKKINIPDNAKPNYRVFSYVFYNKNHRIYFETRNEFYETFSPKTALSFFTKLLSPELLGPDIPEVQVTILPENGAVEKILTLPGLKSLEITVVMPNPDEDGDAVKRVEERLKRSNSSSLTEKYLKRRDSENIAPTDEMKELASVAASNGKVIGVGRGEGHRVELSTIDLPVKKKINLNSGVDFFQRISQIGFF